MSYLTQDTVDILALVFNLVNLETLYYAGGLADQPDWLVTALGIYKAESAAYTEKKSKHKTPGD